MPPPAGQAIASADGAVLLSTQEQQQRREPSPPRTPDESQEVECQLERLKLEGEHAANVPRTKPLAVATAVHVKAAFGGACACAGSCAYQMHAFTPGGTHCAQEASTPAHSPALPRLTTLTLMCIHSHKHSACPARGRYHYHLLQSCWRPARRSSSCSQARVMVA